MKNGKLITGFGLGLFLVYMIKKEAGLLAGCPSTSVPSGYMPPVLISEPVRGELNNTGTFQGVKTSVSSKRMAW